MTLGETFRVELHEPSQQTPGRPFWSPEEVAALFPDETARSVSRWCRQRRIPARKLPNGRWVIPAAWVRELLERGGDPFAPPAPAAGSSDGVGVSPFPALPDDPDGRGGVDPLPGVEEPS